MPPSAVVALVDRPPPQLGHAPAAQNEPLLGLRVLKDLRAGATRFGAVATGTQRQLEILERIAEGRPRPDDQERLSDVGWTMSDASLCGLGQTAAWAVQSAMRLWPELFA